MVKADNNGKPSFSSSSKLDRKTVEKNRRIHMKFLCSKLFNLLPPSHFKISKDLLSQQNQISYVIAYINELKERVESLEKKKQALQLQTHSHDKYPNYLDVPTTTTTTTTTTNKYTLPIVELRDLGNNINIMLISSTDRRVMLYRIINVVEEEGGQVVNASFSTLGNKVFYSLHVEAKISRVGIETSRVQERLQNLINNRKLIKVPR